MGRALQAGLEAMGLELAVKDESVRLPNLTAVKIPRNISDAEVRSRLLDEFNLEIGGGLGEFKGKVWRVGLMGYTCRKENVLLFLSALESILCGMGYRLEKGAAVAAAAAAWERFSGRPAQGG